MMVLGALAVLFVVGLLMGCQTNGLREDSYPSGISEQCIKAKAQAVSNYTKAYGQRPARIPATAVYVTKMPPMGYGAITSGAGKGYRIEIWEKQIPFYGSLVHEFEHALKQDNGHGQIEGW